MAVYIVRNAISSDCINILKKECELQLSETQNFEDKSCVVDLFENTNISDAAAARTRKSDYLSMRWKSFSKSQLTERDRSVIEEVIFRTVPDIISAVCHWASSSIYLFNEHYIVKLPHGPELFRWHTDAAEQLLMFPHPGALSLSPYMSVWAPLDSCSEVDNNGTLRVPYDTPVYCVDAAELHQLQLNSNSTQTLTSVTTAPETTSLDMAEKSCSLINLPGPAYVKPIEPSHGSSSSMNTDRVSDRVLSGNISEQRDEEKKDTGDGDKQDKEEVENTGRALDVPTGSLVLFGCGVRHCSGRNQSDQSRRVFYAQYSEAPITVTDTGTPLNFAVPCDNETQTEKPCGPSVLLPLSVSVSISSSASESNKVLLGSEVGATLKRKR